MKNEASIWLILCVLSYCIAMGNQHEVFSQTEFDEDISKEGSSDHSLINRDLLLFGIHAEESESVIVIDLGSKKNKLGQKFTACHRSMEERLKTVFGQYCSRATNFSIRLRKADFLFPFHYHW